MPPFTVTDITSNTIQNRTLTDKALSRTFSPLALEQPNAPINTLITAAANNIMLAFLSLRIFKYVSTDNINKTNAVIRKEINVPLKIPFIFISILQPPFGIYSGVQQ